MTEQEIREAYPGAADAVAVHEGLREGPPELMAALWDALRDLIRRKGLGLDDLMSVMMDSALDIVSSGIPGPVNGDVVRQMRHPDFRRYVAAKMGMM